MTLRWIFIPMAGGSEPWTPAELTTSVWLDANDAGTITKDGSNIISQWNDKSGNNRHVSQATESLRPLYVANELNGQAVIRFDGDYLVTSGNFPLTGNPAFSTFIVYSKTTADMGYAFGWGTAGTLTAFGLFDNNTSYICYAYGGAANNFFINSIPTSTWMIQEYIKTAGAINSTSSAYKDGSDTADSGHGTSTPNISSSVFTIGSRLTNIMDGDIAEFIVCPSALSESDRQKMEGYLAHKWGLEENLPAGHSYKSSPPTIS